MDASVSLPDAYTAITDADASITAPGAYYFKGDSLANSILAGVSYSAGTSFTLSDSNSNVILSTTTTKSGGAIILSSPNIKTGETCTLKSGSTTVGSVTVSSTISTIGNVSQGPGQGGEPGGGQGGPGGKHESPKRCPPQRGHFLRGKQRKTGTSLGGRPAFLIYRWLLVMDHQPLGVAEEVDRIRKGRVVVDPLDAGGEEAA